MLFVTAFAAILDLETGALSYCNAGHENPYLLSSDARPLERIRDGDGPPLCVVEGFNYRGASRQMGRGQSLCCVTDGVTDAQNAAGVLYGSAHLEACLQRINAKPLSPREVVDSVRADVASFVSGAEPADDLTVLVLRWNGPRTRPPAC
jgi:serine phosphatase RsbU (regulator of sigma subunit)